MIKTLRARGYKLGLIKEGIRKAATMSRHEALSKQEKQHKDLDHVIFVTTYNPRLPNIREKLASLQPILHTNERLKRIFPNPPAVAYRRNRNLNDMLVSRRLPKDLQTTPTLSISIDKNSSMPKLHRRSERIVI